MLIKSDEKKEKEIIEQLIEEDDELYKQHEIFLAEMTIKHRYEEGKNKEYYNSNANNK